MRRPLVGTGALACAMALGACSGGIGGEPLAAYDDTAELAAAAKQSTNENNTATFTMEMDMGPMSMTGSGEGKWDGADTETAMTIQAMQQEFEVRMLEEVLYMKMPDMGAMTGQSPAETSGDEPSWITMSLDEMPGEFDEMLEQNDPSQTLDMLEDSGEIVRTDEDTELDGEPVTYYEIEVDAQELMDEYEMGMESMPDGSFDELGIDSLPLELWLNEDNLPVQFTIDFGEMMRTVAEQGGETLPDGMEDASMTMTYDNWGEPVDIEAPPEEEIDESAELPMPN